MTTHAIATSDASCKCPIWAQRWKRDEPERCVNCGGLFDPKTVPSRRWRPGDPE